MITRTVDAVRGREIATAIGAAAALGAALALVSGLERPALLVAAASVLLGIGALGVWWVRSHHVIEWSTSSGAAHRPRGADRRITAHARSIDNAMAGDVTAQAAVRSSIEGLARAHLARLGLPDDPRDRAAAAALGPDLTAYLTAPTAPPVAESQLAAFITTLEETE